jgi:TPR repeat protein
MIRTKFVAACTVAALMAGFSSIAVAQDAESDIIWKAAVERAKEGSIVAQCELGELVVRGQQAHRGAKVALKWFGMAAEQEALCGLIRMAEMARRGQGMAKDVGVSDQFYERALPKVLVLARQGDVQMQIQLAKMHHKALGTKEDLELAGFWYKTAASLLEPMVEAGDLDAAKKLGNILVIGIGLDRDPVLAGKLYERAAEAGDRAGSYLAGLMWFTGRAGHPVDHKRGFKWLFAAAEADHPRSQYYVGTAFADGLGVDEDAIDAAMWLTLAGDRGIGATKSAMKDLGEKAAEARIKEGIAKAADWVPVYDRDVSTSASS